MCCILTTLLFFCQISCCTSIFVLVFGDFSVLFPQKSKKICQFFAIFSRCVSMIYEKVEKIIAQNT